LGKFYQRPFQKGKDTLIKTSLAQLSFGLKAMQFPKNHVYIVHSSMLKFGVVEGGLKGILNCLKEALGQSATILMPAFTFSFGDTRVWDYHASKAETGALTEYFRKLPSSRRTIHPFHSLTVSGPLTEAFIGCTNLSSFGLGSPFELLYDMEAINISLGTDFQGGGTFLHHTEELARVPYRFHKDFPGDVVGEDGRKLPRIYKMYVRKISETREYHNRWDHVLDDFLNEGLAAHIKVNGAKLYAFHIKPTHDRFLQQLTKDPFYCASRKTYT
jgi:aminoglycoside 3-N-acetyltransferase